eukprot:11967879-Alexandrium_andersonii.AAC.1
MVRTSTTAASCLDPPPLPLWACRKVLEAARCVSFERVHPPATGGRQLRANDGQRGGQRRALHRPSCPYYSPWAVPFSTVIVPTCAD